MKTYVSLFSSAGVGCYGFKLEGFECVATNEIIERRINIQMTNGKCKYDSGYIKGDIRSSETVDKISKEIEYWKSYEGIKEVDVVVATPPCQGMSVANRMKTGNEIVKNSLVVEAIKMVKLINPRFFVFENVPAFMTTACTDVDGIDKPIADAIQGNLGNDYLYLAKIMDFSEYGSRSKRKRTLVIGIRKAVGYNPEILFPTKVKRTTLRESIGHLKSLAILGERDENDPLHFFRTYPKHMLDWIANTPEGMSAFDNENDLHKPHQIIDGKVVINKKSMGGKFKRQLWNECCPCILTRNDLLNSQNTVHPNDNRVFSVRELMILMTIPDSFRWTNEDSRLKEMPNDEWKKWLKKNEQNIRQSIGEAVPTRIFQQIARNITEYDNN